MPRITNTNARPPRRYDPDRLAAALSARSVEINTRAVRVTVVLSSFVTSLLQDYALGQLERNAPQRARELRRLLSSLGPSFVKVGQALSARPDLLPKPYLDALAELQDRLPSFPTPIAMTVIEEELGRPVSEVYSELSPEPVAAASLGQVLLCGDTHDSVWGCCLDDQRMHCGRRMQCGRVWTC